jgi:hypothetical protein
MNRSPKVVVKKRPHRFDEEDGEKFKMNSSTRGKLDTSPLRKSPSQAKVSKESNIETVSFTAQTSVSLASDGESSATTSSTLLNGDCQQRLEPPHFMPRKVLPCTRTVAKKFSQVIAEVDPAQDIVVRRVH